jgi:ketosteroid isomerase-like protein
MTMEETSQTIEDLSNQYTHAVQSRDVTTLTQLYTQKPRFLPPGGDLPRWDPPPDNRWSTEYISAYWHNIFQVTGGGFKYVQYVRDVAVLGEVAQEIGIYDLRMSNTEEEIEAGTYFILWQREEGQWKIAVHILNSTSRPKWGKFTVDR